MSYAVILYDGVCNLCVWSVQFIVRRDPAAYFHFASFQSASTQPLLITHGLSQEAPASVVLIEDGRVYQHSDAAIRIAQRFPRWWRFVVLAHVIPRPIRDGLYRLIARNRYRLFGQRTVCHVPTPGTHHRFLE